MEVLDKIIKKCTKYDLVADYINDNTIKVYSTKYMFDTWLIQIDKSKVKLFHSNKKRNNKKCSYHLQNSFYVKNWFWAIRKINEHNEFTVNRKAYKNTDWVSEILTRNNQQTYDIYGRKR